MWCPSFMTYCSSWKSRNRKPDSPCPVDCGVCRKWKIETTTSDFCAVYTLLVVATCSCCTRGVSCGCRTGLARPDCGQTFPTRGKMLTCMYTIMYSESNVLYFLVGLSANWWNTAKVESRVMWLKSHEMAMKTSGCRVCSLAVVE